MKSLPPFIEKWRLVWGNTTHRRWPWWRVENGHWRRVDGVVDGTSLCNVVDVFAADLSYPLPAPPLMAGQVWMWPGGEEHVVTKVYGHDVGGCVLGNGSSYRGKEWPPPSAILVAGPTPWGRDVPWWTLAHAQQHFGAMDEG